MKIRMLPNAASSLGVGGIATVVQKYEKYLTKHGATIVDGDYDVNVIHAGWDSFVSPRGPNVACLHGMYWTADIPEMGGPYWHTNQRIVESIMTARAVTVPSEWVAETIRREFGIEPFIVPHGVEIEEWEHTNGLGDYGLWAKSNPDYICDPRPVIELAQRLPNMQFRTTFGAELKNMYVYNSALPPEQMWNEVTGCGIYLATVPETFGIATLEAMAAGKPIVGFRAGYQPVIHKYNGYLAEPGDYDDLARGYMWAWERREELGEASKKLAATYNWDVAVEAFLSACFEAERSYREEGGVTVVIPVRNKAATVARALDSIYNQEGVTEPVQIILVDDQSTDDLDGALKNYQFSHKMSFRLIRNKERLGVAGARNVGIAAALHDFIVTLDADDEIRPTFLATCLKKIKFNLRTGVVYTALGMVAEDGSIKKSAWPGKYDFWEQAAGRNQVPTCAMFRKEAWRRAGGFRSRYTRYALVGYGSEDAAFWLAVGARGYDIVQATEEPLFLYYPGGGTSRAYTEQPWAAFNRPLWESIGYPIGVPLKSNKLSWPVKIYSPPRVSVIIPVGPGHEVYAQDAIDSVLAQTFHRTEIIVVWDTPEKIPDWYTGGYPGVKWVRGNQKGAGAARNLGVRHARSKFYIFLDADDMLTPSYIKTVVSEWNNHKAIVYTDYLGERPLGKEETVEKLGPAVASHDEMTGHVTIRNRVFDFEYSKAIEQPQNPPYVWTTVTALIPAKWFHSIGGFDESLESWEDWDLHIRLAKYGYPYYHVHDYLMIYRFHTGKRRNFGSEKFVELNLFERVGKQNVLREKDENGPNGTK